MAHLKDKIENALNETRILVLGAQVLIGVNYRCFFETDFKRLTSLSRGLLTVSLAVMLIGLGVLLLPASYHRIVEGGRISERFHRVVTAASDFALFPFAFALAADIYLAGETVAGARFAAVAGILSLIVALLAWYGLELGVRRRTSNSGGAMTKQREQEPTLNEKVKEVLIEARIVLPGAQALLGFQFLIVLAQQFSELPRSSKYIHFASLSAVALSTIFLIMPAAYHRIVLRGEDSEDFPERAGRMVIAAMFFLGLGVSGDFLVVCRVVTGSLPASVELALALLILYYGLWFGWTSYTRWKLTTRSKPKHA